MWIKIWSWLGLFLAIALNAQGENWVLSETHLGPLRLSKETLVSVASLQRLFPKLKIKHKIASGDSLDFHYFEIFSEKGAVLFTIKSFIKKEKQRPLKASKLDVLTVQSPEIPDEFGVCVGQTFQEVLTKRKGPLEFGAAHHQNYMGAGKIWYLLSMEEYQAHKGPADINPNQISLEEATLANPKVKAISWPYPRWE